MGELRLEVLPDGIPASWVEAGAPPLELDIGCHKGLFLVGMAVRFPERNFLGVELQPERVEKTRRKIAARRLANAAVVQSGGLEAVEALPTACADCLHVLFPDPWPKRRHQNRRLVRAPFLEEAGRVLKAEGFLRLVTDDGDYARAMAELVAGSPGWMRVDGEEREYPVTEFQKKFLSDRRAIHSLTVGRSGRES